MQILGTFFADGSAHAITATATIDALGNIIIKDVNGKLLSSIEYSNIQLGDFIPGVSVDLIIDSNSYFTPSDTGFKWPQSKHKQSWLVGLERNLKFALAGIIFIGLFIWLLLAKIIPAAAGPLSAYIPESVAQKSAEQSLDFLESSQILSKSYLDRKLKAKVVYQWRQLKQQHPFANNYKLLFRNSSLGANALAFPDGTIVVTDDLVELYQHKPELITPVLHHEMAHIKQRHSMQQLIEGSATAIVITIMLGDLESISELLVAVTAGLSNSHFSRSLETEADQYALKQAQLVGNEEDYYCAMVLLHNYHSKQQDEHAKPSHWLEYFASHPSLGQRIKGATPEQIRQCAAN